MEVRTERDDGEFGPTGAGGLLLPLFMGIIGLVVLAIVALTEVQTWVMVGVAFALTAALVGAAVVWLMGLLDDTPLHEREAAERVAVERVAAERVAAERAAVERAAVERAAVERAAVERAAVERAASELAAAIRLRRSWPRRSARRPPAPLPAGQTERRRRIRNPALTGRTR
jgi:hypothetical protein